MKAGCQPFIQFNRQNIRPGLERHKPIFADLFRLKRHPTQGRFLAPMQDHFRSIPHSPRMIVHQNPQTLGVILTGNRQVALSTHGVSSTVFATHTQTILSGGPQLQIHPHNAVGLARGHRMVFHELLHVDAADFGESAHFERQGLTHGLAHGIPCRQRHRKLFVRKIDVACRRDFGCKLLQHQRQRPLTLHVLVGQFDRQLQGLIGEEVASRQRERYFATFVRPRGVFSVLQQLIVHQRVNQRLAVSVRDANGTGNVFAAAIDSLRQVDRHLDRILAVLTDLKHTLIDMSRIIAGLDAKRTDLTCGRKSELRLKRAERTECHRFTVDLPVARIVHLECEASFRLDRPLAINRPVDAASHMDHITRIVDGTIGVEKRLVGQGRCLVEPFQSNHLRRDVPFAQRHDTHIRAVRKFRVGRLENTIVARCGLGKDPLAVGQQQFHPRPGLTRLQVLREDQQVVSVRLNDDFQVALQHQCRHLRGFATGRNRHGSSCDTVWKRHFRMSDDFAEVLVVRNLIRHACIGIDQADVQLFDPADLKHLAEIRLQIEPIKSEGDRPHIAGGQFEMRCLVGTKHAGSRHGQRGSGNPQFCFASEVGEFPRNDLLVLQQCVTRPAKFLRENFSNLIPRMSCLFRRGIFGNQLSPLVDGVLPRCLLERHLPKQPEDFRGAAVERILGEEFSQHLPRRIELARVAFVGRHQVLGVNDLSLHFAPRRIARMFRQELLPSLHGVGQSPQLQIGESHSLSNARRLVRHRAALVRQKLFQRAGRIRESLPREVAFCHDQVGFAHAFMSGKAFDEIAQRFHPQQQLLVGAGCGHSGKRNTRSRHARIGKARIGRASSRHARIGRASSRQAPRTRQVKTGFGEPRGRIGSVGGEQILPSEARLQ